MKFKIIPFEGTDILKLGLTSDEIVKILGYNPTSFVKGEGSLVDDFGFCHVYYNKNNKCEAIEFLSEAQVYLDSELVMDESEDKVLGILNKLDSKNYKDMAGIISLNYDLGITVEEGKVKGFLVGKKGYYDFMYELVEIKS